MLFIIKFNKNNINSLNDLLLFNHWIAFLEVCAQYDFPLLRDKKHFAFNDECFCRFQEEFVFGICFHECFFFSEFVFMNVFCRIQWWMFFVVSRKNLFFEFLFMNVFCRSQWWMFFVVSRKNLFFELVIMNVFFRIFSEFVFMNVFLSQSMMNVFCRFQEEFVFMNVFLSQSMMNVFCRF